MKTLTCHPARYTDALLPIFAQVIPTYSRGLDPFGGTGKIFEIERYVEGVEIECVEIEPEWAAYDNRITVGDALALPWGDGYFDELAELTSTLKEQNVKSSVFGSILAIGRSKSINVIAATQKPLASIVGSVAKSNFPLRLVGRVLSADDAKVAAGQSGTGAEYLPGKGSFLYVDGSEVRRFQSYLIPDIQRQAELVADRWMEQAALPWVPVDFFTNEER